MPTGVYDHFKRRKPREIRTCALSSCINTFECKITSEKRYCSSMCVNLRKRSKESNRKRSGTLKKFYKTKEGKRVREKLGRIKHKSNCTCWKCKAIRHEKRGPMPEEIKEKIRNTKRKNNKSKYEVRICVYRHCDNTFECSKSDSKKYCSRSCSMRDKPRRKQKPREVRICGNPDCDNTFRCRVDSNQKYCCLSCAIKVIAKSEERNKKIVKNVTKFWQDFERKDKRVRAIRKGAKKCPTNPEKKLNILLQKLFPSEYRFVGDGQFILAGRNPDFVNINGQKKIIELYGDYWHGEEFTGRTKEEEEWQRVDCFAQYGYQTLIIWEHELEDIEVLESKLQEFCNVR